jgi:hypothetical protein
MRVCSLGACSLWSALGGIVRHSWEPALKSQPMLHKLQMDGGVSTCRGVPCVHLAGLQRRRLSCQLLCSAAPACTATAGWKCIIGWALPLLLVLARYLGYPFFVWFA